MTNAQPTMETTEPQTCFKVGQITLVPHYGKPGFFVGPGYPRETQKEYNAMALFNAGAKQVTDHLWTRVKF